MAVMFPLWVVVQARESLESLIVGFGGQDLAAALAKARDLRKALELTFSADQRLQSPEAEDVRVDEGTLR